MQSKFQDFLYQSIPLTEKMGLQINDFSPRSLIITAPLGPNVNDKGTVFGGSSAALMIISGWSLITLNCQQHDIDAEVVIHRNDTTWHKAMADNLIIKAVFSDNYTFSDISDVIARKKHQRINCLITLEDQQEKIYSTMSAKYVIIPKIKNAA